jgi:hypothetical protein
MSKKLKEKQQRRLAAEQKRLRARREHRRSNLITIGIALIVGILVVALVLRDRVETGGPVGVSAAEAGCNEIQEHEPEGRQHVQEGVQVPYQTDPPTSGPHYAEWADPGFYEQPIPAEMLVHNLEHGQLVIWYDPDAPSDAIDDIREFADGNQPAMLAAPWPTIENPFSFTITGWAASQSCEQFSEEALAEFRQRYQGRGPEPVGIPTFSPD